jgi:hypothetical protein
MAKVCDFRWLSENELGLGVKSVMCLEREWLTS